MNALQVVIVMATVLAVLGSGALAALIVLWLSDR